MMPCFESSSRNVVATDTESNTASTATPVRRFRSSIGIPNFSNVSSSLGSTCSRFSSWGRWRTWRDRKSTRLNSSHGYISYAVFCLKKKKTEHNKHKTINVLQLKEH